jgi:WD40 repeat protein
VKYSSSGTHLVTISQDGGVRVVRTTDGRIERKWNAARSSTIDISSDSRHVITAGDADQTIRVWDTENLANGPIHQLTQAQGRGFVQWVAFSRDNSSQRIAASTAEGITVIWDRRSGRLLSKLRSHADFINGVEFDPSEIDRLVSASDDATISTYTCEICRLSSEELAKAARARVAQVIEVAKR